MVPQQRRGVSPWLLAALVVAIVGGFWGIVLFGLYQVQSVLSNQVEEAFSGDFSPEVEELAKWDGDELLLVVKFTSTKETYDNLQVDQLLVDNYLPDRKLPIHVPSFRPGKPATLRLHFPGFGGRGGKYAKFTCRYQWKVTGVTNEWRGSLGDNGGLYIPLRKKG